MAGRENLFVSWNECDTDAESLQVINLAAGVPSLSKESQTVFVKSKIDGSIYSLSANLAQTPIFVDQGAWSNTQPYQFGNIVEYDGYRWICKQDHTGQQPVDFGSYWARIDTISQADVDNKLDKVDTASQSVVSAVDLLNGVKVLDGYAGTGTPQVIIGSNNDTFLWKNSSGDFVIRNTFGSNDGTLSIRDFGGGIVQCELAAGLSYFNIREGDATTQAVIEFVNPDGGAGARFFLPNSIPSDNSPTKLYGKDGSGQVVEVDVSAVGSVVWGDITGNIANQPDVNLQNVTNNGPTTTNDLTTGYLTVTNYGPNGESVVLPNGSWIRPTNANSSIYLTNGLDPDDTKYSTLHLDGNSALYSGDGTANRSEIKANSNGVVFLASKDTSGTIESSFQLDGNDIQILTGGLAQILANASNLTLQGPSTQALVFNSSTQAFLLDIPTGTPIQDPVESYYYYEDPVAGELKKTTFGVFKNLVQASDQSQTNFIAMSFTGGSGGTGSLISSDKMDIQSFGVMNILPGNVTPLDGQVLVYRTATGGLVYEAQSSGGTQDLQDVTNNGFETDNPIYIKRNPTGLAGGFLVERLDNGLGLGMSVTTADGAVLSGLSASTSSPITIKAANSSGVEQDSAKFHSDYVEVFNRLLVGGAVDNLVDALQVDGSVLADSMTLGDTSSTVGSLTVLSPGTDESVISAYGGNQGTGRVYVGQDASFGGGIEYNGDQTPPSSGAGADYITLFRKDAGTLEWTARNKFNSNNWEFRRDVLANEDLRALNDVEVGSELSMMGGTSSRIWHWGINSNKLRLAESGVAERMIFSPGGLLEYNGVADFSERILVGGATDNLTDALQVAGNTELDGTVVVNSQTTLNDLLDLKGNGLRLATTPANIGWSFGPYPTYLREENGVLRSYELTSSSGGDFQFHIHNTGAGSFNVLVEGELEVTEGLETPKLLNVPAGTIENVYGEDSSGNLVKGSGGGGSSKKFESVTYAKAGLINGANVAFTTDAAFTNPHFYTTDGSVNWNLKKVSLNSAFGLFSSANFDLIIEYAPVDTAWSIGSGTILHTESFTGVTKNVPNNVIQGSAITVAVPNNVNIFAYFKLNLGIYSMTDAVIKLSLEEQ